MSSERELVIYTMWFHASVMAVFGSVFTLLHLWFGVYDLNTSLTLYFVGMGILIALYPFKKQLDNEISLSMARREIKEILGDR